MSSWSEDANNIEREPMEHKIAQFLGVRPSLDGSDGKNTVENNLRSYVVKIQMGATQHADQAIMSFSSTASVQVLT